MSVVDDDIKTQQLTRIPQTNTWVFPVGISLAAGVNNQGSYESDAPDDTVAGAS